MKATWLVVVSLFLSMPMQASIVNPHVQPPPLEQKAGKVNLNQADVKTLAHSYKGIGKKRAEAIVNYREKNGNFHAVEDLANVRGIGKSFVKKHLADLQRLFTVG